MNFDFNLKQSSCGAKNLALLQKPMHRKSKKWLRFMNKVAVIFLGQIDPDCK
jgi:hypothetical protein